MTTTPRPRRTTHDDDRLLALAMQACAERLEVARRTYNEPGADPKAVLHWTPCPIERSH